jgi:hypothetical protein
MRWGLVPFWDKSEKPKIAPINARSEDAFAKPMFRQSIQKRRALIPADGTPQPVSDVTHRDEPKKSPTPTNPSDSSRRPNASDLALHSSRFEVPVDVNDATDKLRITSFGNEFEALLKRHRIELPPDELEKAQSAFVKYREREAVLEANLADVSYPSSTQCVLLIPPHAEASSKLLADFKSEIASGGANITKNRRFENRYG